MQNNTVFPYQQRNSNLIAEVFKSLISTRAKDFRLDLRTALRVDARRDPPDKGEARAGSERTSSRWTHIAQQNRSTGEPARAGGISALHGPPTSTRFGKARCVSRGPAGGSERDAQRSPEPPTCVKEAAQKVLVKKLILNCLSNRKQEII